MKKLFLSLLVLGLAGCLVQPNRPAEPPIPTEFPPSQDPGTPDDSGGSTPSPTRGPAEQQGDQGEYPLILELAVRDLASRLEMDLNEIEVFSILETEWPNPGLGCELPGANYAQVITPGYIIRLAVQDEIYTYHTDSAENYLLCLGGQPQLPSIPVDPDEIQDGIPWMPVDPVPTIAPGDTIADPDPVK